MVVRLTRKEKAGFGTSVDKTLELIGRLDDSTKEAALAYLQGQSSANPVTDKLINGAMDILSSEPNSIGVIPVSETQEDAITVKPKIKTIREMFQEAVAKHIEENEDNTEIQTEEEPNEGAKIASDIFSNVFSVFNLM